MNSTANGPGSVRKNPGYHWRDVKQQGDSKTGNLMYDFRVASFPEIPAARQHVPVMLSRHG